MSDEKPAEEPAKDMGPLQMASTHELLREVNARYNGGIFFIAIDDMDSNSYRINRQITSSDPRMLGILHIALAQYEASLSRLFQIVHDDAADCEYETDDDLDCESEDDNQTADEG